ncbi:MAG TPA: hypothetical protein VK752_05140 [Bryobacteraceae bacterium]|jgi:hypothetical protein|nr:hypothetical protein [Bryobacteraceae bacterium]
MAVDLSFLEPYFQALSQVPHLQQAAAQQEQQQQQLAETTRHNQADEAVAGRHADYAADANRRAQQAQDLTQADTILKNGWTPVGSSQAGAAPPAAVQPAPAVGLGDETGDPDNAAGGAPAAAGVPGLTGSLMATAPVPAAATPRQTMTVGGQQYLAPPKAGTPEWKEEHARQLQQGFDDDAAKHGAQLNREGIMVPDAVADTLQIPRGQKILPEHVKALADLHNIVAPPEKQWKPDPPPSMVTLSPTDSKLMGLPAGTRMPMDEYKSRGTVAAEASRAARGEGGGSGEKPAKPPTGRQLQINDDTKAAELAKSEVQRGKDRAAVLKSRAADKNFDLQGALKQAEIDHADRQVQIQKQYEQGRSDLYGADVGHNDWADRYRASLDGGEQGGTAASPGRAGAAAPAAAGAAGPKQLTDMSKVGEYMKKAGGDKVAARKAAAADGFVF